MIDNAKDGLDRHLRRGIRRRLLPVANRLARGVASPYPRAPLSARVGAGLVDGSVILTGLVFYIPSESLAYPFACATYLLLRDSTAGRSFGKFCFSLVVIDLHSGRPCGRAGSAKRNAVFLLPGANMSALFLESASIIRDVQGQRLGDRIAQTQVVQGFGAKELVTSIQNWWRDFLAHLDGTSRDPRKIPVKRAP